MKQASIVNRGRRMALTLFFILPVLVWLSGCSIYSQTEAPQSPTAPDVSPTTPGADVPESTPGSTSTDSSLIRRAEAAFAARDFEQALTLLERAQRIDSTNADIYLALARTYSAKGDVNLAQTTAERGLLYCRNDGQCDRLRAFSK